MSVNAGSCNKSLTQFTYVVDGGSNQVCLVYLFSHKFISSVLTVEQPCFDEAFERLSTLDERFSIGRKITLCPNSVSLNLLDFRFPIFFGMSSKSRSERHKFSSTKGLDVSLSSWLPGGSLFFGMSSKSRSERHKFSSTKGLDVSLSSWVPGGSLNFLFWEFADIIGLKRLCRGNNSIEFGNFL